MTWQTTILGTVLTMPMHPRSPALLAAYRNLAHKVPHMRHSLSITGYQSETKPNPSIYDKNMR